MASGFGILSPEDLEKNSDQILREHEASIRAWGSKLSQKTLMGHLKTAMGHRLFKQWMNQFKPPKRCETLDALIEFDLWLKKMEISENISPSPNNEDKSGNDEESKEVPSKPTPVAPATSTVTPEVVKPPAKPTVTPEVVKPPAVPAKPAAASVKPVPAPSGERAGLGEEMTEAERVAYKNHWQTFKSPKPPQKQNSSPVVTPSTTPTSPPYSAVTPDDVRKKLVLSSPEGQHDVGSNSGMLF